MTSETTGLISSGAEAPRCGGLGLVSGAALLLVGAACGAGAIFGLDVAGVGPGAVLAPKGVPKVDADVEDVDPFSGEVPCGADDSFDFMPLSSADPDSKKAIAKALEILQHERQGCEGGALPLPVTPAMFELGGNATHSAHVHHKFASHCEGETFKVHLYMAPKVKDGPATSIVVEVYHGLKSRDWRLLTAKPRACEISTGVPSEPETASPNDKYIKHSVEFALNELTYQMKKHNCTGSDGPLRVKEVLQARVSIEAGMRVNLALQLARPGEHGEEETHTVQLIVEQTCDGHDGGRCMRQLYLPGQGDGDVCKLLEADGLAQPEPEVRRLVEGGFFGHIMPDATEALAAQQRALLRPRRLAGDREPIARRYIKEGAVPDEYDPRGHECLKHITVYDQGSCGSCYANAVATMMGVRHCFQEKGMPSIHRRLQELPKAANASQGLRGSPAGPRADAAEAAEARRLADCADSALWALSSGHNCAWFAANDAGCEIYRDYGQVSHCQKTCGTCPKVESDSDNPWNQAEYQFMPNAGTMASCTKDRNGQVAGCGGGNTQMIWDTYMMSKRDNLWVMGAKCKPYDLKCWTNTDGGVVNPITNGRCSPYKGYEMWHKPCSCIPKEQRPTQYSCPTQAPPSGCGHPIPYAMFTIKNMAHGLPNAEAVLNIQRHIAEYGPIYMSFEVMNSFSRWDWSSKPVYNGGGDSCGGHAVSGVGWGTQGGLDYWLLRNSWGHEWAEQGYFKYLRGSNHGGIESREATAAMPVADFADVSEPFCEISRWQTLWSYRGSSLAGYTMRLTLKCAKTGTAIVVPTDTSGSPKDGGSTQVDTVANVPVKADIDLLCSGFGLSAAPMVVFIRAQDAAGNVADSTHHLSINAVPGMTPDLAEDPRPRPRKWLGPWPRQLLFTSRRRE